MKVLHINQQNSHGGAARIAYSLVEGLNKIGISSELWYFNEKDKLPFSRPFFPLLNNLSRNRVINKILNRLYREYHLYYGDLNHPLFQSIEKKILRWKPDLIHLHNLHGGWVDLSVLERLSKRISMVVTIEDEWLVTGHCGFTLDCLGWKEKCSTCPHLQRYVSIKRDISGQLRKRKGAFLDTLARQNCIMVSPSDWMKQRFLESDLWHGRKIEVIFHGSNFLNKKQCDIDKEGERIKLGFPPDELIGIFVADGGTKNYWKGYDILHAACLTLPEKVHFTLLVVGDNINSQQKINIRNVKEIRLGYLSTEELAKYLSISDVFLYPSKAESFGIVVTEAMAAGLLVVASNVGPIPELVEPGTGILFPEGDINQLARIINDLFEGTIDIKGYSDRAMKRAHSVFSYERMLTSYLKLYNDLIG